MPRKSDILRPSASMVPDSKAPRRHTYASSEKKTTTDLFAFSMHATDPTSAYFDEILASPTPDDMYLDSFHGDDTMHGVVGPLPLLSLDEEKEADDYKSTRGKSPVQRSKSKKKKSKSKRLSSESQSSKKSTGTKSKRKSSRSSKSKKSKTPAENKNVDTMLKKLEEYEESLQEEWNLLRKERASITAERETFQLTIRELESKLDGLEYNGNFTASKSRNTHNDSHRIENAILQRRLRRQHEIILQLSNSNEKVEQELRRARELNAKNEKIIRGQKLTIERMEKETSGSGCGDGSVTKDHITTDNETFPIQIVGQKMDDDNDDGTASISSFTSFAESTLEDSFSSLQVTKPKKRKAGKESRSLGQIKCWVKARSNVQRELFRNRIVTPEEAALSSLVDSI